jgi:LuxR family maltose regulon positive regulatory protein
LLIAQCRTSTNGQPNLQPLLRFLDRQAQTIEEANWGRAMASWGLLDVLILKAMALQVLGDVVQALSVLQQALILSEPEGFVLAFVDEGTPMARLLYQATECGIMPEYVGRLLAAFETTDERRIEKEKRTSAPPLTRPPALIEPLTKRELEILELIADGLSNREIADRLIISVGTVKVHARNIYGKLQVSRRTEAIARARHLGLL